ncbi:IS21-like element helper ATPase IstB [Patescibacteria group bacterium]|nr:IS21-like element helper ATPase IstB [Patescibacteria group bacterium]
MTQHNLEASLKELKLYAMLKQYLEVANLANKKDETYENYLGMLTQLELEEKNKRRIASLIRNAKLPLNKSIANFDFSRISGFSSKEFNSLSEGSFLKEPLNIVFYGGIGVGKTHLAIALVQRLSEKGFKCYFSTLSALIQELINARLENRLSDLNKKLDKFDLIVCDELGYLAQTQDGADLFFQLISQRYERKSLLITTNLTYSEWDKIFINPLNTAVAVERIIHNCITYNFKGDSKRREEALKKEKQRIKETMHVN